MVWLIHHKLKAVLNMDNGIYVDDNDTFPRETFSDSESDDHFQGKDNF